MIASGVLGGALGAGLALGALRLGARKLGRLGLAREAWALVAAGSPRRARALLRLHTRGKPKTEDALTCEALALFWEGSFDAALTASCHAAAVGELEGAGPSRRAQAIAVLALTYGGDAPDARHLLSLMQDDPREEAIAELSPAFLEATVAFHEGLVDRAANADTREAFGALAAVGTSRAHGTLAALHLAAIAHAEGDLVRTREILTPLVSDGGPTFVRRWALHQLEAMRVAPGTVPAPTFDALDLLRVPAFHRGAVERVAASPGRLAALFAVSAVGAVADVLTRTSEVTPVSWIVTAGALAILPLVLVVLAPLVGLVRARVRPGTRLRAMVLCSTGMPLLLAALALARVLESPPLAAFATVWALALVVFGMQALSRAIGRARAAATAALVALGFAFGTAQAPPTSIEDLDAFGERDADKVLDLYRAVNAEAYAARLEEAEAALLPSRPGADLYFLSFAGYSTQDVFTNESVYARETFDAHYGTEGRSMVLSNGRSHTLPAATTATLAHALATIGRRMDPAEDVLFLYLTSHGDDHGLALRDGVESTTLTPAALRRALDDAGIVHRIVVVAGCQTGVFLEPLQTEHSVVMTASASYRSSYGCANGRAFTELGERLFRVHFANGARFLPTFEQVIDETASAERAAGVTASLPRLSVGAKTATKLADLEDRLGLR